jgi:hypothetical protein
LNRSALHTALQQLVDRHAALRTHFLETDKGPVQRVVASQEAVVEQIEGIGWPPEQIQATAQALHNRGFDLAQGPLWRATLLRHADEEHTFLFSVHHIVNDGWSLYLLVDELFLGYEAARAGRQPALPPLRHHYADYLAWQQRLLAEEEERLWHFWQTQLAGELPLLELPTDFPRPATRSLRGISHPIRCSAALVEQLKEVALSQGCTLYMVLLAAYQLLIHRHSGQEQVLVGLPTAGRERPEFEAIVGYFTAPVVLRTTLTHSTTFAELLAQVKAKTLAAFDHQEYPFARLVERLDLQRDPSRAPLVESTFVLQKPHRSQPLFYNEGETERAGLRVKPLRLNMLAGQDDIALELFELHSPLQSELAGDFLANADLFSPAGLAQIAARFVRLLEEIGGQGALAKPASQLPNSVSCWQAGSSSAPSRWPPRASTSSSRSRRCARPMRSLCSAKRGSSATRRSTHAQTNWPAICVAVGFVRKKPSGCTWNGRWRWWWGFWQCSKPGAATCRSTQPIHRNGSHGCWKTAPRRQC